MSARRSTFGDHLGNFWLTSTGSSLSLEIPPRLAGLDGVALTLMTDQAAGIRSTWPG